jgi:tetratricopeptide (TPR) repeat protein
MASGVELRRGRGHRVELIGDVPLEGRLDAFVRALGGRGRPPDARLVAAAAMALEDDEIRELTRRARVRCTPAVARAVYLVRATGRADVRAQPSSRPVWLRADGPRVGFLDEGSGVRVNAPDGIARGPGARPDWLDASLSRAPRGARALLALACLGVGLDPELARHVLGAARVGVLGWLESSGFVVLEAERLVAVPPLSGTDLEAPARDLASALAWLDAHREPRRRAEGVDLRLRVGAEGALARALEEAPGLIERGEGERLERWIALIEPSRPLEARRLRAGALERSGLLHEALAVVRDALAAAPRDASLALDRARLAWRLGKRDEAASALRGLRRRQRTSALEIEVELLRATMASERGEPHAATRHLERARAHAEQSGDGEGLAQVLRRLGTLEARAGRPRRAAGAYRAALAALARVTKLRDVSLETALVANLATMESWLGNHEEAERLYRVALERRRDRPIERLNTLAALALLGAMRGERVPGGFFGPLVAEAERVGDPRLRASSRSIGWRSSRPRAGSPTGSVRSPWPTRRSRSSVASRSCSKRWPMWVRPSFERGAASGSVTRSSSDASTRSRPLGRATTRRGAPARLRWRRAGSATTHGSSASSSERCDSRSRVVSTSGTRRDTWERW